MKKNNVVLKIDRKEYYKKHNREYYIKHREKILRQKKKHNKQYYLDNKDEIIKKVSEYRKLNKDKCNERNRKRHNNNMNIRLRNNLKTRINDNMSGRTKSDNTMNLIGCSIIELKIHLESKFKEGMNWGNYGNGFEKWNIDHIMPCASFDLSIPEEQIKCFNYNNLQPLWSSENCSKQDKLQEEYIEK